jgi:hypothetical protein
MSFLRPAWIDKTSTTELENDITLPILTPDLGPPLRTKPCDRDETVLSSIGRCFDTLKRRCLADISPDFVDPKFCLENAQRGCLPAIVRMGSRPLPSFEDFLLPASEASKKTMHTRGIRKNDDDEAIEQLSKISFLPSWSILSLQDSDGVQAQEMPHHETMMPFPTLCLELIRLRLNNGYYRQPAGIVNDLTEAYVTSVLYVLSGPASRKKSRLSTRKISKHLQSAKNINQVATFVLPKEAKKKSKNKAKVATTVEIPSATSVEVAEEPGTCSISGFSDEEAALITRIDKIRRLYATVSRWTSLDLLQNDFSAQNSFFRRLFVLPSFVT